MYKNEQRVQKDYKKTFEWYQKSTNQGYAIAQYKLGLMYENDKEYKKI